MTTPPTGKHYSKVINVAILKNDHTVVSFAKKSSKLKMFSTVMSRLMIKIELSKRIIIAIFVITREFLNISYKSQNDN